MKDKFGGRGPNTKKCNANGFYEATIKKETKVWYCLELSQGNYIGSANNDYWYYPCYENPEDPATLQWWFIYYE